MMCVYVSLLLRLPVFFIMWKASMKFRHVIRNVPKDPIEPSDKNTKKDNTLDIELILSEYKPKP